MIVGKCAKMQNFSKTCEHAIPNPWHAMQVLLFHLNQDACACWRFSDATWVGKHSESVWARHYFFWMEPSNTSTQSCQVIVKRRNVVVLVHQIFLLLFCLQIRMNCKQNETIARNIQAFFSRSSYGFGSWQQANWRMIFFYGCVCFVFIVTLPASSFAESASTFADSVDTS